MRISLSNADPVPTLRVESEPDALTASDLGQRAAQCHETFKHIGTADQLKACHTNGRKQQKNITSCRRQRRQGAKQLPRDSAADFSGKKAQKMPPKSGRQADLPGAEEMT
jgi:hypothetical protein